MLHDSAAQRSKLALVPIPCAPDCDTLEKGPHWTNLTKKTDFRGKREQGICKDEIFRENDEEAGNGRTKVSIEIRGKNDHGKQKLTYD